MTHTSSSLFLLFSSLSLPLLAQVSGDGSSWWTVKIDAEDAPAGDGGTTEPSVQPSSASSGVVEAKRAAAGRVVANGEGCAIVLAGVDDPSLSQTLMLEDACAYLSCSVADLTNAIAAGTEVSGGNGMWWVPKKGILFESQIAAAVTPSPMPTPSTAAAAGGGNERNAQAASSNNNDGAASIVDGDGGNPTKRVIENILGEADVGGGDAEHAVVLMGSDDASLSQTFSSVPDACKYLACTPHDLKAAAASNEEVSADGKTWWLLTRLDAAQIAEALSKPAAPRLPPTPPVKTVQLDEPRVTAPPLPTDQPGELKINPTPPAPEPAAPERAPEREIGVLPAPPEPTQEPEPQLEVTPAPGLSEPTQDLEPEPAAESSPEPLPTSVSEPEPAPAPEPVSTASSEVEPSAEVSAVAPSQTDIDSEVTQLHGQPVPSSADRLSAPVPAKLKPESTPAHASEPMQEPMPAPAASVDGPVLVDGPLRAEASARDSAKEHEEDAGSPQAPTSTPKDRAEDLATAAAEEAAAAAKAERIAAAETVAAEKAAAAAKERELRERENAAAPMSDSWNSPSKSPTPLMRAQALAAAPPVHNYDLHAPMGIPEKIAVVTPHKALKIFEVGLRAHRRMSMQEKLALPVRAGYVPAESEDNGEGSGDEVGAGAGDGSLGGRLQRAQTSPARFTTTPSKNAQQLQFDAGVDRPHAQSQPDKGVMDARDDGEDDDDMEKSNGNLASAGSADDAAATTGDAAEDTKIKRNPAMLARFAVKIQSYFRGYQARRHLEVKQKAAKTIQVHYGPSKIPP